MAYPKEFESDAVFQALIDNGEVTALTAGSSRAVYVDRTTSWVLKVALNDTDSLSNWTEIVRSRFAQPRGEVVLGAILSWSQSGKYLVMEYLQDISAQEVEDMRASQSSGLGVKVPEWFTDWKPSSFGKHNDKTIKIRDYACIKDREGCYRSPLE